MLKNILLFLAGLLVGANAVYYLMTHGQPRTAVAAPAPDPGAVTPGPVPPAAPMPPAAAPESPTPVQTRPAPSAHTATPAAPGVAAGGALLLPVQGVRAADLHDTYNQTRDGARPHEALDIMAARGTPVLAAIDGMVEKLFTSKAGGLTLYEFGPAATHAYYYAHLDRYAAGLREGQALRRGDVIGYVGSTGNASPDAPHLHFAIFALGPEKRWSEGTPVNPFPLLTAQQ